jgi:MFS family permease
MMRGEPSPRVEEGGSAVTSTPLTSEPAATSVASPLTPVQWVICAVAALGFAFDVYEITLLAVIARPALADLGGLRPGASDFNLWVGLLFYVPFVAGGVFGLLGGYLVDRFGRRRVLVWSILLYSLAALASGFAASPGWLLLLRSATIVGVCVEYVAAVAWLAELFPNARQRSSVLGYTQAFTALGGLMVTVGYYVAVTYGDQLPAIRGGHEAWRYTLLFGVLPTVPLIVIRPFLPESPVWREKKALGTLERPSLAELFRPDFRLTTVVTTVLMACSLGASFGAVQHVPRIVLGLAEVRDLPAQQIEQTVSAVHFFSDVGQLAGRLLFVLLVLRVVNQRRLLRLLLVPGLVAFPIIFAVCMRYDLASLKAGTLVASTLTVAQFSFWWNYLPRVYPTHLRGSGEGFAGNVGGRMIGTAAAPLAAWLSTAMPGGDAATQLTYAAASVGFLAYAVGLVGSFWLPEPAEERLPE